MSEKLPTAEKNTMLRFILDYLAGNMARPSEIKLDLQQEYYFLEDDFDHLINELVQFDFLDRRGEYLSLTLRGRFLLKESPDQISLDALEQMKELDSEMLVRPKITQKPFEMLRWYRRALKYFPTNTHRLVLGLILFCIIFYLKIYIRKHILRN